MSYEGTPAARLQYQGDLGPVIERACTAYGLGGLKGHSFIDMGLEDCNIRVDADDGAFVLKVFAATREAADIQRYATIMQKVTEAGVHHPELRYADGRVVHTDDGLSMACMRFIEGTTYIDAAPPAGDELDEIIAEAAKTHKIPYHPSYEYDSWAIPNISDMFARVKQFIADEDMPLIEWAMAAYDSVPKDDLPHCLVHGDIIKSNVMKSPAGMYLLDFSVANWYPRIQELAVMAANLLHDDHGDRPLKERCALLIDLYEQHVPLTDAERRYLYPYAVAGVAMELLGAHQEKYIRRVNPTEADYWLQLGRAGLQREFAALRIG